MDTHRLGPMKRSCSRPGFLAWLALVTVLALSGLSSVRTGRREARIDPEPTDPATLEDLQRQAERGRTVYAQACLPCHQAYGQGLPGFVPSLANSDYLMADRLRSVRIVLGGQSDRPRPKGRRFEGVMFPLDFLSDAQIADVLTYVRNKFGNAGDAVHAAQVADVRKTLSSRLARTPDPNDVHER